jgi:hypothetical protein
MEKRELKIKIESGLLNTCTPKAKEFWIGYIAGLYDFNVIVHKEYAYLRDTIDLWRKGDKLSRMVTPESMRVS